MSVSKMPRFFTILALLVAFALWLRFSERPNGMGPDPIPVSTAAILPPAQAAAPAADFSGIAEQAVKGVVNISSIKIVKVRPFSPFSNDPFFQQFFGRSFSQAPREYREKSLGSGVIVSATGHILTNNHVVSDAAEITIKWMDQIDIPAKVVGTDPHTDLALLKISPPKGWTALPLGDSDLLRLAEPVLAIGSPFGLGGTVTQGIVSAKGRANVGIVDYEDFIQTDAAINPGNSGGALVNFRGELVGINTAIFSKSGGYQGIGFAIPVNMAKHVMEQLLRDGKIVRGWLGLRYQDLTADIARALQQSNVDGVIIAYAYPRSPASNADVRRGDVILSFNGTPVKGSGHLNKLISEAPVGSSIRLTIRRGKETFDRQMRIEPIPESAQG